MPRVAHAAVPRLARALVGAGLQADLAVPALLDLLFCEVPLVFGRHLGTDLRPGILLCGIGDARNGYWVSHKSWVSCRPDASGWSARARRGRA